MNGTNILAQSEQFPSQFGDFPRMDNYLDREQTKAKHFILRGYLQELAFKVLHNWDTAYIDGFSGPWRSKSADFSDTSFMIAINVLKDAQNKVAATTGVRRGIKCFFSERDPYSYKKLVDAVTPFHNPREKFEILTFNGDFVDAIPRIQHFIGSSFPLIFIDPTGWTGYPFEKIAPLFRFSKCETLINFMYGHISRFVSHPDEKIIASLNPILGGPGWQARLDASMKPGLAVERLFRETLRSAGNFKYVVSTKIDRSTTNRPHFFLAYATKNRAGLKAFREIEYKALREHARDRSAAQTRKRETKTNTTDLFGGFDADRREASIDDIVREEKNSARRYILDVLSGKQSMGFIDVADTLMQTFILRESAVKDICVELAREGLIINSWGSGNRKPNEHSRIDIVGG